MHSIVKFVSVVILSQGLSATLQAQQPAKPVSAAAAANAPVLENPLAIQENPEDKDFKQKLNELLKRTEESVRLLRVQITESQTAPFLANLYLQLGDLLTQKSTALYYVQMEKQKDQHLRVSAEKAFSPVVVAQQEAIGIYRLILKDFPQFPKRREVLYRLATALKAIDEVIQFTIISEQLIKDFPDSDEALKSRLLLGQHFLDNHFYQEAVDMLKPATSGKLVYESNLAKYRTALALMPLEKYPDALKELEEVIRNPNLKEQDNPYALSLTKRMTRSDLKREALIDSIRAYTFVFPENPDPVSYYSKLAPSEIYFQEVIEKLALRYINLQKYEIALKLLRTLSERTAEPQKVVNIYQEVLLQIPIDRRAEIPVEEMKFVLNKYTQWISFYKVPRADYEKSYLFFEKQIRDLGTRCHDLAKLASDPEAKKLWLSRSRDYYELYLGFFEKNPNSVKIAIDLADVFFNTENYLSSGDYYLRIFNEEFGKPSDKKPLIENAILCFQKKGEYSYYETTRMKGLLMKAIESYSKFDAKIKNDPGMQFTYVKAKYEQSLFPEALNELYDYMKKFSQAPQAADAGELILDYFNTRNDFSGLQYWTTLLTQLKLPNAQFNQRLNSVGQLARSKVIQEKVKTVGDYDEFAQGKSYLSAALSVEDESIANEALKEALAKSKKERDLDTFFKAAAVLGEKEKDPVKRGEIRRSLARENGKMTRYYSAIGISIELFNDAKLSSKTRLEILDEILSEALILRDWQVASRILKNPSWTMVSAKSKVRLKEQLLDALESPTPISEDLTTTLLALDSSDETVMSLYKNQSKLTQAVRARVFGEVAQRCANNSTRSTLCRWSMTERLEPNRKAIVQKLATAPTAVEKIEESGKEFQALAATYQSMEGTSDPQLEIILSLRQQSLYTAFANYLLRVAGANAELASVLKEKAGESQKTAQAYIAKCNTVQAKTKVIHPATKACAGPTDAEFSSFLVWNAPAAKQSAGVGTDPKGAKFDELQKAVYFTDSDAEPLLDLAKLYYSEGYLHHAAAAATYGAAFHKGSEKDFSTVLGCTVLAMGYWSEAYFRLEKGSEMEGMRDSCMKKVLEQKGRS